jgi:accessory gene regulator protein AgrB
MNENKQATMEQEYKPTSNQVFLWVVGFLLFASIVTDITTREFNSLIESGKIVLLVIFVYRLWTTKAGIVNDEFTSKVLANGVSLGLMLVFIIASVLQFFVVKQSPVSYMLEGISLGTSLTLLIAVIYSWWKVR